MNMLQDFMNGATQRDPHFTAELDLFDDFGFANGVRVTCKLGDFSTSQIVSRQEIETVRIPASQFGAQIRRMLWEQVVKSGRRI